MSSSSHPSSTQAQEGFVSPPLGQKHPSLRLFSLFGTLTRDPTAHWLKKTPNPNPHGLPSKALRAVAYSSHSESIIANPHSEKLSTLREPPMFT